jgi:polyhydroxyalkanoate synthase
MIPELPDPLLGLETVLAGIGGAEETARVRRGMWILATTPRPPVGQTPNQVVFAQNKLQLRYYAPARDEGLAPVVLVPSLINKAYILDLEPDRSLVAALSAAGHPTYLVDWGEPAEEDAEQDVGTVVLDLLHRSIDRACRHSRAPQAILLGYCQGGTLSAMYAALRPARVKALVTLTAPVRFQGAGRFATFVDPAHFDVEKAIDDEGLLPIDVMRVGFKLLDPMGNWSKHLAVEAAARNPAQLARVLARERWLEENVPMAGAFAREFIRHTYQSDDLIEGRWVLRGERVDLGRITCPLLVVACKTDFIAPLDACLPLTEKVSSEHVRAEVLDVGHIGVVVGGSGPKHFYPLLNTWFREVQA